MLISTEVLINYKANMEQDQHEREMSEEEKRDQQEYDTFLYKFQQQIIDAWKPVPYTKNNVILYTVLTVVCITLGLVLILTAPKSPVIEGRYDNTCEGTATACSAEFTLTETMPAGAFLYYGFTNYYQNHRRYLKYFSPAQMGGNTISESEAKTQCGDQAYTNGQLGATLSADGGALSSDDVAFPCGERARSYLKAKDQIKSIQLIDSSSNPLTLNASNIAWPADTKVYKNGPDLSKQCIDNNDQDWLVWFRPGARKDWFKLKAKIEDEMPAGKYFFKATKSIDISDFGQKYFHISTSNYIGNRDHFLGIAFLALGGGCLIVLIVFIAKLVTEIRERPKIS